MRFVIPLAAVLAFAPAAGADPARPTFDEDVLPVFRQHCVNCHGNDKQKGDLNLATFAAVQKGGSSGVVVVAGNPDKSRVFTLTAHKEEPKMPPKGDRIPEAQLTLVKLWIEQGARENSGSKAVAVRPSMPRPNPSRNASITSLTPKA